MIHVDDVHLSMEIQHDSPSGKRSQFAIENGNLIVDLSIKRGDFP